MATTTPPAAVYGAAVGASYDYRVDVDGDVATVYGGARGAELTPLAVFRPCPGVGVDVTDLAEPRCSRFVTTDATAVELAVEHVEYLATADDERYAF